MCFLVITFILFHGPSRNVDFFKYCVKTESGTNVVKSETCSIKPKVIWEVIILLRDSHWWQISSNIKLVLISRKAFHFIKSPNVLENEMKSSSKYWNKFYRQCESLTKINLLVLAFVLYHFIGSFRDLANLIWPFAKVYTHEIILGHSRIID